MSIDIDLLEIQNEKTSIEVKVVDLPLISDYDFFVRYNELEYKVVLLTFFGLCIFFVGIFV